MMIDDLTGKEVKGYELLEQIGAGGFGAVYRASQPVVGREVAIKIILPQYANKPEFIRSFESEARLVARLEHPHIVPLYDYWREPSGAYLVMRLLRQTLNEVIAEAPLELERAGRIIDQISAALATAHLYGVVHRDIKPGNILMDDLDNAYLVDFGLARVVAIEDEEVGMIMGSPGYISPEQITGEEVSGRTDIYALGVVLFEMLTGRQPFYDQAISQLIFKHLQEPMPSLMTYRSSLPEAIDDVIQRATAKDPLDRYADALEFARAFRAAFTGVEAAPGVVAADFDMREIANPYKGLRAFEEVDADDFYGREVLTERLMDRLVEEHDFVRFLAVIGPSGSGKSSVVKAGVLPSLRRGEIPGAEEWFIAEMVPDIRPLEELWSALLSVAINPTDDLMDILNSGETGLLDAVERILPQDTMLLLVIDQFEEAFTMAQSEKERAHFLSLVRHAVEQPGSRVRVIVTLRADFIDQPLQYPGYGELIRQRTEFVLPLTAEEIESAIARPAERVGLEVDPNLLAAVVRDVSEEPGTLPLLQYALTEVFERRRGRTLTLEAYIESGGALGALARRADELYQAMDEQSQAAVRQLFLRLVTLGEGTQDTRRRVGWSELSSIAADNPAIVTVRDAFIKYRLLTSDRDPQTREPTIEVAHEALLREWQLLREWLQNSRDDIRTQRRLAAAAAEWRAADRERSFLMTGAQLEQIDEWAGKTDLVLTEEERAFLAASVFEKRSQDNREKMRNLRRIEEERRARNRLQVLVAVMTIAVGVALGLTVFAFTEMSRWEGLASAAADEQGRAEAALVALETQVAAGQSTSVALENSLNAVGTQQADLQGLYEIVSTARADTQRSASVNHSLYLAASARSAQAAGDEELALALAAEALRMVNPPAFSRDTLAELLGLPQEQWPTYSPRALVALAENEHGARELSCEERELYSVAPLCEA